MSQPVQPQSPSTAASYAATAAPAAPGRFVWHDLMTTDPARAVRFYEGLFGWRAESRPMDGFGDYTMFHVGEEAVAGMVPLDPVHGVGSHWISYVTVPSVDEACGRAAALGGTVGVPPTDIPEIGRFAVVRDPHGAVVSPFTFPDAPPPERHGPPPDGSMIWFELMTPDPTGARAFHEAIFGWTFSPHDMGEFGEYWIANRNGAGVAGVMPLPDEALAAGATAYWLPYVQVADVDGTAARAGEVGGTVVVEPTDVPDVGRFAVLTDPSRAYVALMRPLPMRA